MKSFPSICIRRLHVFTVCLVVGGLLLCAACKPVQQLMPFTPTSEPGVPTAKFTRTQTSTPTGTAEPPPAAVVKPEPNFTLTPTPTAALLSSFSSICSPLNDHSFAEMLKIVTNPFDPPQPGKDDKHHGVDFAYYRFGDRQSIEGTPVQSMLDGVVALTLENTIPYGNVVIIETPYVTLPLELIDLFSIPENASLYLLYAHMAETPLVGLGDRVTCGQELGQVGNTPPYWSGNPHLHLETRLGPPGVRFESMRFYDNAATIEEMDNYRAWRMSADFIMLDPLILIEWASQMDF